MEFPITFSTTLSGICLHVIIKELPDWPESSYIDYYLTDRFNNPIDYPLTKREQEKLRTTIYDHLTELGLEDAIALYEN